MCLMSLAACAASAGSASAQVGNGLYEPFPPEVSKERARRFVERLPAGAGQLAGRLSLSTPELERGVFVSNGSAAAAGPPLRAPAGPGVVSARADGRSGSPVGWPLGAAAVLLAFLGLRRTARRKA